MSWIIYRGVTGFWYFSTGEIFNGKRAVTGIPSDVNGTEGRTVSRITMRTEITGNGKGGMLRECVMCISRRMSLRRHDLRAVLPAIVILSDNGNALADSFLSVICCCWPPSSRRLSREIYLLGGRISERCYGGKSPWRTRLHIRFWYIHSRRFALVNC